MDMHQASRILIVTMAAAGWCAAQNVAPARPVQETPPGPAPVPVAPARPVEEAAAAGGQDGGFLTPDPANDLFKFAGELFARNEFGLALTRYDEFLRANPNHPMARQALYQMGECLRRLDRNDEAEQVFALIVDRYKKGELVDMAAYRAAALAYNRRDYRSAVPYFKVCRLLAQDPKLKLDATFRAARSLQNGGEPRQAAPLFREVIQAPEPNPFKEPSSLALARQLLDEGKKEESLALFLDLAGTAKDPAVRAESLVRAGLMESDLGRHADAEKHYAEIFNLPSAEAWKPVAQFGLIRSRYQRKDHEGVVAAYNIGVFQLSDEMRAQMFLMTGHSYQRLGKLPEAIKVYGILENFYQGKPEGSEAGYRRLECLYQSEDVNLPAFVDHFIATEKAAGRDHVFLDRALLLKAEILYARNNPVEAAAAYAAIRTQNLPEKQRATALYKRGWAESEAARRPQAIDAFTRFIAEAPQDPRVPMAMAQRGEMYALNGAVQMAVQDFLTIIEKYPDSQAVEFAYQRAAELHGSQNDIQAMIKLYNGLLEKFPETKAAPDAHYALGRGYYQIKDYAKAAEHLRKARDLDPKLYGRSAGSRLVLACYGLKDAAMLRVELDAFLKVAKAGELPPQVPAWLGVSLYEQGDPAAADDYLTMAANEQDPKATEPVIRKFLAKARLDAGRFAAAVRAADNYLATVEQAASRASGLLDKGRAQLGLQAYDAADTTAAEGQQLIRQGKTNAWLGLLRGDIASAREQWDEAIKHYVVPSQTMVDPEITPLALYRTSQALQKSGRRDEAKKYRAELEQRFPLFQPPPANVVPKAAKEERPAPSALPQDLPAGEPILPEATPPVRTTPGAPPAPAPAPGAISPPAGAESPEIAAPVVPEVDVEPETGPAPDPIEAPPEP